MIYSNILLVLSKNTFLLRTFFNHVIKISEALMNNDEYLNE